MSSILLLHGALGSQLQLRELQLALEQHGNITYTLDFSGHCGVPFSPDGFGIERFSLDVLEFLQERQLTEVNIFGYSMGGYVALWFALQHPELVGKILTLGTKFDWSPESAHREVIKLDPEKIAVKVPAFARILEHRHSPSKWKELLHRTADMMTRLGATPLLTEEILRKINHPVLICLGDRDDMADRDYSLAVSDLLPNGKFLALAETPHPIEKVACPELAQIIHSYCSED
ncbi:MAG: alpha/beta hydrolase [Cyclobacteriaceae bacterium]|nr:alpha/beta hydrolase [Cyclobacteriaceae bacterium]